MNPSKAWNAKLEAGIFFGHPKTCKGSVVCEELKTPQRLHSKAYLKKTSFERGGNNIVVIYPRLRQLSVCNHP